MTTVSIPFSIATRIRDLFVLYAGKSAFKLEEYSDVGGIYKRFVEVLSKEQESVEVSETDCKYVLSAINVCSQRIPVEVQNYRAISELLEVLAKSLKSDDDEDAESKAAGKTDL